MQYDQRASGVRRVLPYPPVHAATCFPTAGTFEWSKCDAPCGTKRDMPPDRLAEIQVERMDLAFAVSRDEEYVRVFMKHGNHTTDMGDREHNYLLLLLARKRLDDRAAGLPEPACGWVDQDDWTHDPAMVPARINLSVFRIRRQYSAQGVVNAAHLVERRRRTRELRIGVPQLSITRI